LDAVHSCKQNLAFHLGFMTGSRPLATALVPAPGDTQYSTLEVDHNRWLENDGKAAPIVGQDPKDEKIVSSNDEKIISYNDVSKQAVVADVYNVQSVSSRLKRSANSLA